MNAADADVLIVGAGPVGTALALDLALRGRRVRVLEARPAPVAGSRAIGIHPPGLAVLEGLGVAATLLAAGRRVRLGRAVGARGALGTVRLDPPAARFPFVLTVPQSVTEAALRAALLEADATALVPDTHVTDVRLEGSGATVVARTGGGHGRSWRAAAVVGADGRDGVVRRALGIARRGGRYPDRYVMADLADDPERFAPDEAWVALHPDGVVEGFPLPGGVRRWVVWVPAASATARADDPEALARRVAAVAGRRLGVALRGELRGSASAFGIERWSAVRYAVGPVALVGDAAHVVSPIGGQGMNLGWLDAAAVAAALDEGLAAGDLAARLAVVAARRRRAAARAIARAAWNTALGRPRGSVAAAARDALVRAMLRPPLAGRTRARFTMEGLA